MITLGRNVFKTVLREHFGAKPIRYFSSAPTNVNEKIEKFVKSNKIVVFMKGSPEQPLCGFSNAVIQILNMYGVSFDAYNVLEDEALRNGIKEYSRWPTIPQVFINGEFVGGCDILLQLHRTGNLRVELENAGIPLTKVDADPKGDKKD